MQAFTIFWIIWVAILVNWFRWTNPRSSRELFYIIGSVITTVSIILSFIMPVSEKVYEIEQPKILEYGQFKNENYLFYSFTGNSETKDSKFIWLPDDINKEKAKRFYRISDVSYFGIELNRDIKSPRAIERR